MISLNCRITKQNAGKAYKIQEQETSEVKRATQLGKRRLNRRGFNNLPKPKTHSSPFIYRREKGEHEETDTRKFKKKKHSKIKDRKQLSDNG